MDMYAEHVIDHAKNPRNYGTLLEANMTAIESNPLCGDEIIITMKTDENKVKDIRFKARGCAISQASASMLCENVKGKYLEYVESLTREYVLEMMNITLSPSRLKCAMLPLNAIKKVLKEERKK